MQVWHFSIWKLCIRIVALLYFIRYPLPPLPCTHTRTPVFKSGTNVSIEKKTFQDLQLKRCLIFCKVLSVCNGEIIFQACLCDLLVFVKQWQGWNKKSCLLNLSSTFLMQPALLPRWVLLKWWHNHWNLRCYEKEKHSIFEKNLDRTLGQMAVGERWKAVPCVNKIHSIQFTLVMEHIALNFITQCYHIKSMWLDVCVVAAICT